MIGLFVWIVKNIAIVSMKNRYTEAEIETALREILEMREEEVVNFFLHLVKVLRQNK